MYRTHGLQVRSVLIWLSVWMLRVPSKDRPPPHAPRLSCLSLFWHFLDIIWIFVFTIVYLMGVL